MADPFIPERLITLFERDASRPRLLKRRESTTLELKENFHLSDDAKSDYGKTMCAFSNRHGGYIIFGIKNSPHEMLGMTNDRLESLDPNKLTQFLNNHFEPSVDWRHFIHEIDGNRFGVIYVAECRSKPMMCVRQFGKLREGEIYYRYAGESKVITAADLQQIIQDRIESERKSWQDLLARTARSNPSSTYLLDVADGKAEGEGRSFLIGKDLLSKINFIHSGQFAETGEPTLRVLGDVEVVRTETVAGQIEVVDPSVYCKFFECEIVNHLKDRLGRCVPFGEGKKELTGKMVRDVIKAYDIPTPSKMYYRPDIPNVRPLYGQELIDWFEREYEADPHIFYKAKTVIQERLETKRG